MGVGEGRGTESREWLDSPSMTVVMLEKLRTQWLPGSGSSLPHGCWESNLGPLQKQVLLTTD